MGSPEEHRSERTPEQVIALVAQTLALQDGAAFAPEGGRAHRSAQAVVAALREAGMLVEPEWEYALSRFPGDDEPISAWDEKDARAELAYLADIYPDARVLRRRSSGPWMEVPSE